MQILGISGSPRHDSNSDAVVLNVLKGARQEGAGTQIIRLRELDFSPCTGCEACHDTDVCPALDDDMQHVLERVKECRGLVTCTPTHNFNCSALMKAFIDRLNPIWRYSDTSPRTYVSLVAGQGRAAVAAAVAGQSTEHGMGYALECTRRPLAELGYEIVESLPVLGFYEAGAAGQSGEVVERCLEAGRKLARALAGD
jgi:multimeric flavodoxin WrbA